MSRSPIVPALIALVGLLVTWSIGGDLASIRTDPSVLEFELPVSRAWAESILESWRSGGQIERAREAIEVDFGFIIAYVILGLGLALLAGRRIEGRVWRWLLLAIPPVAGTLDWYENRGMIDMLDGRFADGVPAVVTALATTKFLLLAIGVVWFLRVAVPVLKTALATNTWLVPLIAATAWTGAAVLAYRERHFTALLLAVVGLAFTVGIAVRAILQYRQAAQGAEPLGFAAVEKEEHRHIEKLRSKTASGTPFVGLALSGGGVRSATFNLGLLQALARLGLLSRLDYLSTVSGGGYIGSWLMRWVRRKADEIGLEDEKSRKRAKGKRKEPDRPPIDVRALEAVERELGGTGRLGLPEPRPVAHLRDYSNYLTPQVGLFTADTWTTIATYVRNLLLNLLLITALASSVLLLPRALQAGLDAADPAKDRWWLWLALTLAALAVVSIAQNLRLTALGMERKHEIFTSQGGVQRWGVLPLVASAILASHWFGSDDGVEWSRWQWALATGAAYTVPWLLFGWATSLRRLQTPPPGGDDVAGEPPPTADSDSEEEDVEDGGAAAADEATNGREKGGDDGLKLGDMGKAAGALASRVRAGTRELLRPPKEVFGHKAKPWVFANAAMALVGLPVGAVCGVLLFYVKKWAGDCDPWTLLTFGPAILMSLFTLGAVLSIGLAGVDLDDHLREWMARAGAWIAIYSIGWLGFIGIAVYGPVVIAAIGPLGQWVASSGWLVTSVAGALAGNAQQQGHGKRWHRPLLSLAPWVFVAGLVLALAWGLDAGLSRRHGSEDCPPDTAAECNAVADRWDALREAARLSTVTEAVSLERNGERVRIERRDKSSGDWLAALDAAHKKLLDAQVADREFWLWLAVMAAVALVLGWRIDINEFSMHNYYRNRLVRAFLGASNPERSRRAQPFTGMDPEDDSPLGSNQALRPLHIVNTSLNLVAGKRLAWQQRKAAALALTPLHTGFELPPTERGEVRTAYRKTDELETMTLGKAMAISGAAASPNMGFRSSPPLALLLTVFNVRLGWWLGNPCANKTYYCVSPRFALKALLAELFGLTSLEADYVYLSDGGHFENLGLYELVRRRCRYIILSDAGADPDLGFEDLGNAIRKCRNDLGVEIDIDVDTLKKQEDGASRRHCVVGELRYLPEEEGGTPDKGWLLYIKASLTGDEPEDVHQYALQNPSFPHQSTGDQFFDEPQFESYRRLGLHIGERVFGAASKLVGRRFRNWERLFSDLKQRWYAPSTAVEASFSRHGDALAALFRQLREDRRLRFLDAQIYGELESVVPATLEGLPARSDQWIAGFYFCNSMIRLMENVYLDLHLDEEADHPDNRGWINLFQRWADTPMFRATWAASAVTYGSRFQTFGERELGLTLGEIEREIHSPQSAPRLAARMKRGLAAILKPNKDVDTVLAGLPPDLELWELFVNAQGLRFPIGFGAVKPAGAGSHARLLYFEIRPSLRECGLAQRALRFLSKPPHRIRLADDATRITEIRDARWKSFRHFFDGAVVG